MCKHPHAGLSEFNKDQYTDAGDFQITNFLVAFITPILLARSSSAIYFLFGGCLLVTIVVGVLFMPETKGRDLEAIGDVIGLQKVSDIPIIHGLQKMGNQIRRRIGRGNGLQSEVLETRDQGIELENRS